MRDFRKLNIWKSGIAIAKDTLLLAEKLPVREKYGLAAQVSRASVSIPSNIAEGCSRNSCKETVRFINIALGSAFELETQLIIIQQMSWVPTDGISKLLSDLQKLQKQINAFRSTIR